MIKVIGKTNPFTIKLATTDEPFKIDNFYEIEDPNNNNPICRVIKSENLFVQTLKNTERELSSDVQQFFPDSESIYLATAKVENYVKMPIAAGAEAKLPSFEKIKPFLIHQELGESFVLGEISGTDIFMSTVPEEYKNLFMVRKDNKMVSQTSVPLLFDYKKLSESPHIGLFGGSGSGKTFALKVITEELMKKRVPTILFDPHIEMDFSSPRKDIPKELQHDFKNQFSIFRVGEDVGINFSDLSTDELVRIIGFASELSPAMENLLRLLHARGDTYVSLINKIDNLTNIAMQIEAGKKVEELSPEDKTLWKQYGANIPTSATLKGISWRINSINATGVFDKDINTLKTAMTRREVCVVRGEMKALNILGSYLISKLYYLRKNYIDAKDYGKSEPQFLPFVIAMDEAHIFCPKNDTKSPIKSILRTIAQEGRKYGVFEIMATQRPSLLDETVVAQMSTKFIFKLNIKEDLMSVQRETDLSQEEIDRLPYINSGETFISSNMFGKTISAAIRYNVTNVEAKTNPFNELDGFSMTSVQKAIIRTLPIDEVRINDTIEKLQAITGHTYSQKDILKELEILVENKQVLKVNKGMSSIYQKA